MVSELRCAGCNHRFGRRAKSLLLLGNDVFCLPCAGSIEIHRKLLFACNESGHTICQHDGTVFTTVGRVKQAFQTFA
jgi:hypothetical protein